ncbi:MAG TPA: AbrB family transcriptional regulator [Dokdonella sp.]
MPTTLAGRPRAAQWAVLGVLSAALTAALLALRLPAALLLGPMLAAIACGTHGAAVRVVGVAYTAAQAVVGVMIAGTITPSIAHTFAAHWPWFIGSVAATLAASSTLGFVLSRSVRRLPGTTAIWGVTPGAATAMVLMAESFGADARLVAFMQYLRVIFVALGAAGVAHFWLQLGDLPRSGVAWFAPLDTGALAATLALTALGAVAGVRLRVPAGPLLVPAFAAIALHLGFGLDIALPAWLLAATYALIGWSVGLRFTLDTVRYSLRALGPILFSIVALIAVCAALSWLLARLAGVDALTAYLAMSPGGMDTVAIIAASSPGHVDLPFVMALQTVRLLFVVVFGPPLARFVATRAHAPAAAG